MSKRISIIALGALFALGLAGPIAVHAATAPGLGVAETYAVFGKAGVTNNSDAGTTHIWGNVGADSTNVTNLNDGSQVDGAISAGSGVEAAILSAYGDLASQGATASLDLAGTHTVTPGVYTVGSTTLNGTLTLNGPGVYIFRSSESISTSGAAKVRLINGATACNVFWQIPTSMTIGAGSEIIGTILASTAAITLADGASLQGRALARTTQVTLINNSITQPTCSASATESPIIKVTKEASKKNLTSGPDKVTFTYRVTNKGDVALSNISVKDDKCDSVDYASGDANNDDLLDTSETWVYRCEKTVKKTETNTVTAKGTANGVEVKDTDTAKVTVSTPGLPATGVGPADENNNFWSTLVEQMSSLFSFRQ